LQKSTITMSMEIPTQIKTLERKTLVSNSSLRVLLSDLFEELFFSFFELKRARSLRFLLLLKNNF